MRTMGKRMTRIVFALVAVAAIVALSVALVSTCKELSAAKEKMAAEPSVFDAIATRTSIRMFDKTRPVGEDQIERMLRAAMAAPTAVNKQPWEFVVVTDKATLSALSKVHPHARIENGAMLVIAVCGSLDNGLDGRAKEYWVQDCSAATENLLLAAHGLGLGAVWCGVYPMEDRIAPISEILAIPQGYMPLNLVTIGYPAVHPAPKDKWNESKVHRERW